MRNSIADCLKMLNNEPNLNNKFKEDLQSILKDLNKNIKLLCDKSKANRGRFKTIFDCLDNLRRINNNEVSILTDKVLLCEQIIYFNDKVFYNHKNSLRLELEMLAKKTSNTFNIASAGSKNAGKIMELKNLVNNMNDNQIQIMESLHNYSNMLSNAGFELDNAKDRIKDIQQEIKEVDESMKQSCGIKIIKNLFEQLDPNLESNKLKLEQTQKLHNEKLTKFKTLDDKFKKILEYDSKYLQNFGYLDNDNKNNQGMPTCNNIAEIRSNVDSLNLKIQTFDDEINRYNLQLHKLLDLHSSIYVSTQTSKAKNNCIMEIITDYTKKMQIIEEMIDIFLIEIESINSLNIKESQYKENNDITKEKVNAIVNSIGENLDFSSQTSKMIASIEGKSLIDDCQKCIINHNSIKSSSAIVTKARNLPCEFIIHAVLPSNLKQSASNLLVKTQIKKAFENILKVSIDKAIGSLSIPAFSGKILGLLLSEREFICLIFREFIDANQKEMKGKSIIICINDSITLEQLESSKYNIFDQIEDTKEIIKSTKSKNSSKSKRLKDIGIEEDKSSQSMTECRKHTRLTTIQSKLVDDQDIQHINSSFTAKLHDTEGYIDQYPIESLNKSFSYNPYNFHYE